jgi:L-amino acid N-acyltransferase YncA
MAGQLTRVPADDRCTPSLQYDMPYVRPMAPTDWPAIHRIYEDGIATGTATLDTIAPSWMAWDAAHLDACRVVAEEDGEVVAWAALTPVSGRCAYGGVAELSIYVAEDARGKKVGKRLLEELVLASEEAGFWTLQAQVFDTNEVSIHIHEAAGFRVVGVRERIGRVSGEWVNVVLLERRSQIVGV